jgi:glutamine amidotransferase
MNVAIIKYNAGNIRSVDNAVRRLGIEPIITSDAETIRKADKVIFPGQGEAASTMAYLKEHKLDLLIKDLKQPVLGICIGMQLMCRHSEEGNVDCLGIFDTDVVKFRTDDKSLKIPQMGWNNINELRSELFHGLEDGSYAYFIHSYHVPINEHTACTITKYKKSILTAPITILITSSGKRGKSTVNPYSILPFLLLKACDHLSNSSSLPAAHFTAFLPKSFPKI